MQRQLDGDLDDRESEALMSHTRHCQQCAAMFERLQLLSAGLESLPKVTPPYSLVDAILPRLAELSPAEEGARPAAAGVPSPSPSQQELRPSRSERTARPRRWTDRFSVRALGGVVAAGVVVGLFLVTNGGPKGADDADMSAANFAADAGAPASQESLSTSAPDSAGGGNQGNDPEEVSAASSNDAAEKGEKNDTATRMQKDGAPDAKRQETPSDTYIVDAPPSADNPKRETAKSDKGKAPNFNFEISNDAGGESADDGGNSASVGNAAPDEAGQVPGFGGAPGETNGGGEANPNMGIAKHILEQASPNGKYKATVDEDRLFVYNVENGDLVLLYMSDPVPGGIGAIAWAADSKSLTYEVATEDGVQTYVVDPEAGTGKPKSP